VPGEATVRRMRRKAAAGLGLLLVLLTASAAGAAVRLERIRTAAWEDRFRVVMDLSQAATYREQAMAGPDRIVIDIERAAADGLEAPAVKDEIVRRVRTEPGDDSVVRVIVELARAAQYKVFTVPAGQDRPFRIVCDVLRSGAPAPQPPPPPHDWVVVIDPGHGGRDPGVVSEQAGLREEQIVLDVAQRLQRTLAGSEGVKVVLTRGSDKGLRLGERVRLAEDAKGDAFISIHVNGCPSQSARGAEVFFLSLQGATDSEAHAVAELENAVDAEGLPVPSEIARLPFGGDLIQTATHQHSSLLAEMVLEALGASRLAATRGVKQANFVVLRSYRVPSVLIELGFISNPADARQLASPDHRQALAETIARGLLAYRDRCLHPSAG
jgi:N-acetylmuramoyl-L-alanine amidase